MKKVLLVTITVILGVALGFALNAAGIALLFWLIDLFGKTTLFTLRNVLIGAGIVTVIRAFFMPCIPIKNNND